MSAFGDGNWKQPNSQDKTPAAARRAKRMSIAHRREQRCLWAGCEEKPRIIGKPYCEKHEREARGK